MRNLVTSKGNKNSCLYKSYSCWKEVYTTKTNLINFEKSSNVKLHALFDEKYLFIIIHIMLMYKWKLYHVQLSLLVEVSTFQPH